MAIQQSNVSIAAPTGLAAFNVGSTTIHRLLQLPVEHEGKSAMYGSLTKPTQKVMKTTLCSVKVIIVDEVPVVSSLNFAYMHLRLNELFGGNDWFGSKNMLFMGDLLQLQPVNGSTVFDSEITPVPTGLCSHSEHLEGRSRVRRTHYKRASKARPRVFVNVRLC